MRVAPTTSPTVHAPAPRPTKAEATPTTEPAPATQPTDPTRAAKGKGAENRSEVATLRQWVNHPERRDGIVLPDLEATHQGKGFANALAAYRAVLAELAPPVDETQPGPVPPVDETTPDPVPPVDGTVVEPPPVVDDTVPPPVVDETVPPPTEGADAP